MNKPEILKQLGLKGGYKEGSLKQACEQKLVGW